MKLPVSWLKRYMDISLPAEKLAALLTLSGSKVERVEKNTPDSVMDIEVTTNRPDCLSMLGLAYEVSAVTGKKVKKPAAYLSKEKTKKTKDVPSLVIEDKKGCPLYTGRVLRNVKIRPSPGKIQTLLGLVRTRAISNVVDATNFVLFESGQPLHAFDLDKIKGGTIVVRRSRKGEKFYGIDGIEYVLDEKTLIIADAERPIAIAGVIGGKLTEVDGATKNIFLESAYFDPALVRQASKKYKISTESSYRFERSVNPENVAGTSRRAAELIQEWAGGEDASGLIEKNYMPRSKARSVTLRLRKIESLLGLKLPVNRISNILKSLSFTVKKDGTEKLKVTPDSSRGDITIEADLLEEVLRMEGFDKAPETLAPARFSRERFADKKAERVPELKKFMAHQGLDEIMSYSLLSEKALAQSGMDPKSCHAVANAVSAEQAFFRPSLLPGLLQAVVYNAHRKANSLKFFEVGNCYVNGREETRLGVALYGMQEENWQRKTQSSFYDLKGIVENVTDFFGLEPELLRIEAVPGEVLKKWDIPHEVFFAEIRLDKALTAGEKEIKLKPVPKFPSVRRDIAFVADSRVPVNHFRQAMKDSASPYMQDVWLFDQYTGKNIPQGKRSLAFSIAYQKEDGTFTEEEIQELQKKVGEALKSHFQVEFR